MVEAILLVFSAVLNKDERFLSTSQLFKLLFICLTLHLPRRLLKSPFSASPTSPLILPPSFYLPADIPMGVCHSAVQYSQKETVCLMLMAARCPVFPPFGVIVYLNDSRVIEERKKKMRRGGGGACQQMSHHSICCESTIGRHKERKIKIWQWQINLKTNWLSQAEFINAFTTRLLRLAVIKMQWSQSDVCRLRWRIHCFRWDTVLEYI